MLKQNLCNDSHGSCEEFFFDFFDRQSYPSQYCMKLSFTIPAYNEEACLGSCLQSVFAQIEPHKLGQDIEIIVVNNASTDKTKEVALSFPNVRVVDEYKKGVMHARQAGFVAASGDIIANIDADVILPEGWIERAEKEFSSDKALVALSGPYLYYDAPLFQKILIQLFYLSSFMLYRVSYSVFGVGAMAQFGNFAIRREVLLQTKGYNTDITFYGDDTDTAKKLSAFGKVKWTLNMRVLSSYRRLKGEGIIRMGIRYTLNYFWVTFFSQPFTKEYKDIRS